MFLRQARAGFHTYLRLVENYREGDRVRQRVVLHLGRKDLLAPHLDSLVGVLQADDPAPRWVGAGQLSTPQAWTWGPVLAARHLFTELGLGRSWMVPARRPCVTTSLCPSACSLCSPIV